MNLYPFSSVVRKNRVLESELDFFDVVYKLFYENCIPNRRCWRSDLGGPSSSLRFRCSTRSAVGGTFFQLVTQLAVP